MKRLHFPSFIVGLSFSFMVLPPVRAAGPVVSNIRAAQRSGTHLVDIHYNLAASASCTVYVAVSDDGGASYKVPVFTLTGAVGPGVTAGNDRHIVWHAGTDWPGKFTSQCKVKITADDGITPQVPPTRPPPGPAPAGFVRIPAGTFVMGSPTTEKERVSDETQHTVTISYDFYMSKYEVTQREYLEVMGNNPSWFTTKDGRSKPIDPDLNRPVETVTWDEATDYCGKVTDSEQAAGRLPAGWVYRLPTEAEWEYACRAGTSTPFHHGSDLRSGMANFFGEQEYVGGTGSVRNPNGTYLTRTTTVGSYAPNAFGLYDMHGNIWEWCLDWFGDYPSGNVTDPRGLATGSRRVHRGGAWGMDGRLCRSAARAGAPPSNRYYVMGFRVVLASGQP
jgi:formylglycine-generating enzyme required for sulfatase activity